ncbi:MAG: type I glyceraldehyde-3-phosphate dehydrogenase [Phycisphaeraceae bacterium]
MAVNVGINGFGRIGRLVLRAAINDPHIRFVGINDLVPPDNLAYLLKYDSNHGRFPGTVYAEDDGIVVNGRLIPCFSQRDPAALPWAKVQADYVVESTGLFTDAQGAVRHIEAGAKRVVITAPTKTPDVVHTFVPGINLDQFHQPSDNIVSMASCTTNCLAPIAKVVHEQFGIAEGLMTTVHALTATQPSQDGPSKKDWRGGRSAGFNIIPSATGAAKAVGLVLPQLKGKITGMAFRVPTADVSVVDLTVRTVKSTSYGEICAAMKRASEGSLLGILAYTEDEVVSSDFRGAAFSAIFDAKAGIGLNDHFFKLIAWYDNEWGYSHRIVDMLRFMSSADGLRFRAAQHAVPS